MKCIHWAFGPAVTSAAAEPQVRYAAIVTRVALCVLSISLVGCLTSRDVDPAPVVDSPRAAIRIVVDAPEAWEAEELLADLRGTQLFADVARDGNGPFDLRATYRRNFSLEIEGFCDDRGEWHLLAAFTLFLLPSCFRDTAYDIAFSSTTSERELLFEFDYEARVYTSPIFFPMILSERWRWGHPSAELRRAHLRAQLVSVLPDLLHIVEQTEPGPTAQ